MSLIGDSFGELNSLYGEELTHYPHNGYADEGDEFWQEDQGWDRTSGTTFTGLVEKSLSDEVLEAPGFDESSESAIRTDYGGVSEGDLVVIGGQDWIAKSVTHFRSNGGSYQYVIGVISDGS